MREPSASLSVLGLPEDDVLLQTQLSLFLKRKVESYILPAEDRHSPGRPMEQRIYTILAQSGLDG